MVYGNLNKLLKQCQDEAKKIKDSDYKASVLRFITRACEALNAVEEDEAKKK